jgi:hypothetical protein
MPETRIVKRAVVAPRRNTWGEWVVRAYDQHGKRWPEADYHTDDKADAEGTAKLMVKE